MGRAINNVLVAELVRRPGYLDDGSCLPKFEESDWRLMFVMDKIGHIGNVVSSVQSPAKMLFRGCVNLPHSQRGESGNL